MFPPPLLSHELCKVEKLTRMIHLISKYTITEPHIGFNLTINESTHAGGLKNCRKRRCRMLELTHRHAEEGLALHVCKFPSNGRDTDTQAEGKWL